MRDSQSFCKLVYLRRIVIRIELSLHLNVHSHCLTSKQSQILEHDAQVLLPVRCKLVYRKLAYFLAVIADASIVFFSQSIHKMDERSFSASRGRLNLNPLARMKSQLLSPNI